MQGETVKLHFPRYLVLVVVFSTLLIGLRAGVMGGRESPDQAPVVAPGSAAPLAPMLLSRPAAAPSR